LRCPALNRAGVTLVAITRIDELDLPARRPRMDAAGSSGSKRRRTVDENVSVVRWGGPPMTDRNGWRRVVAGPFSASAVLFINSFEYDDSSESERADDLLIRRPNAGKNHADR